MKKSLSFFSVVMMAGFLVPAAQAEWMDAQVTSINTANQTMQIQRIDNRGDREVMTVKLDKNAQLQGYDAIRDVRTGDRVRVDVDSSFLGTKTAKAINASAAAQANARSDRAGINNREASAKSDMNARTGANVNAGTRANTALNTAGNRAVSRMQATENARSDNDNAFVNSNTNTNTQAGVRTQAGTSGALSPQLNAGGSANASVNTSGTTR